MEIAIYYILTTILSPFLLIFYLMRLLRKKETLVSIKEKFSFSFGKNNIDRNKKLIWIHSVSIGELNSIWSLVKRLNIMNKYNILVTTSTITSSEIFKKHLNKIDNKDNIFYSFFPVDIPFVVKRFLKYWKPDLMLNVESEIWPCVLNETNKICKIISLNAKISEKSLKFWLKNKTFAKNIFNKFDVCFAQTKDDLERLKKLGAENVEYYGNLKFCVDQSEINEEMLNKLSCIRDKKHRWLVNSTHKGEEEIVIEVHKLLKKDFPDLFTCIIIRHPNRREEVIELLKQNNINFASFADGDKIDENTEILLYDKIGNLGVLFELFKIVFMCGSLLEGIGGHTPVEASKQKCCTITGTFIPNNKFLFSELEKIDGSIILKDNLPTTIYEKIKYLIENPDIVEKIGVNAFNKTEESSELLKLIINKIEKYV